MMDGANTRAADTGEVVADIATNLVDLQGLYAAQELLLDDLGGIGLSDPFERSVREGLIGVHAGMGYMIRELAVLAGVAENCHARQLGEGTDK